MTERELGKILKEMYDNAQEGYQTTNILLFGVEYAPTIIEEKIKPTDIVRAAGLHPSFSIELRKGIKLSKFVVSI